MMKKKLIYILLLVCANIATIAQDMQYSQFFANKLDLNPAFAGSQYYHRIIMNYRNQWPGMGDPYVTYSFSYDRHIKRISGGIGVQVSQDRQANGALVSSTITGIYSYFVKLGENSGLRFGLGASVMNNYLDMNKLKFPDMVDPQLGAVLPHNHADDPVDNSKLGFDSSVGILAHMENYHFGVSFQHLNQPSLYFSDEYKLPHKITAHWGAEFPIRTNGLRYVHFNICPLFMYQKQGSFSQMNYGMYISRNNLIGGAWIRQNFGLDYDSAIFMVGFDNKLFRFAYSYDFSISKLMLNSSGSHEISLIFLLGERNRRSRIRPISCPKIFRKMNILEM